MRRYALSRADAPLTFPHFSSANAGCCRPFTGPLLRPPPPSVGKRRRYPTPPLCPPRPALALALALALPNCSGSGSTAEELLDLPERPKAVAHSIGRKATNTTRAKRTERRLRGSQAAFEIGRDRGRTCYFHRVKVALYH